MGERDVRNVEVRGSIPLCSTILFEISSLDCAERASSGPRCARRVAIDDGLEPIAIGAKSLDIDEERR